MAITDDWVPTHCPSGDAYRQHAEGCKTYNTLTFELRSAHSPWESAGHARHCCDCGAFLPCRDAIDIARAARES